MPTGYVTKNFIKLETAYQKGYTTASLQGSARSSKTYSVVQWLVNRCISVPNTTVSIVRATLPAIKRSVFRDFIEIISNWGVYNPRNLNKSELVYHFDNGSWIEFFSCENEQKLRGPKRQILYVNEANEISYIEWQQLQMRTTMFSIIDYNPSFSEEHWINQVNDERKTCWWISTYKDNPFLEQRIIDEIESLQKKNPSLWRVYGLGLRAIVEGLVFPKFEIVNYMPTETMRMRFAGQDLGYSQDPSAGVEVRFYGNDMYINEIFYRTHMLTNDLIREWKQLDWYPKIISESADPRLIDELYNAGLDIHPVRKYAGSIQAGIMKMQEFNIKVTAQSVNVIKELRNYTYRQDKEGKWLNEPVDSFNHCVSADTLVTTQRGEVPIVEIVNGDLALTSNGLMPIIKLFTQGVRETWEVKFLFNKFAVVIRATPDHKFKTKRGWKQLQELTKEDVIYLNISSSMVESTDSIKVECTEQQHFQPQDYQRTYGNSIMENRQKGKYVSLRTATPQIFARIISFVSQSMNCAIFISRNLTIKEWKNKCSMARYTTDTKVNDISAEGRRGCIEWYGNSIMEQSPKGITSIILTKIQAIIASTTCSSSKLERIFGYMLRNIGKTLSCLLNCAIILKRLMKLCESGIKNTHIKNMSKKKACTEKNGVFANGVEKNILSGKGAEKISAQKNAKIVTKTNTILDKNCENAKVVEKSSIQISSVKENIVVESALKGIVVLSKRMEPTYDIEVEGEHEFFANGILVHNCIDATRYVVLEEILGDNAPEMSSAAILGLTGD